MRLEERGGLVTVTVVTNVSPGGQAEEAGVVVGCTVVGINGERYLGYAHTIASLQHGRRPITVTMEHAS